MRWFFESLVATGGELGFLYPYTSYRKHLLILPEHMTLKFLVTSLFAISLCATASAVTYVYEPFNMTVGNLDGQSSPDSSGLSTAWNITSGSNANNQVTSGSLSFGDLVTSGNSLTTTASNGSEDGEVIIDSTISIAGRLGDGSSLWFSLLIDGGVGSNAHSGFAFGTDGIAGAFNGVSMNGTGSGLGVYYQGSTFRATSWVNGTRTGNGATFSDGGGMLLVGHINWGADNDTMTLYTPSVAQLALGQTGSAVSTITTATNLNQSTFDTISYTTRGSSGGDVFDEIRFGSDFASVAIIPEPSATLLGGLGALMLLRRRRA